MYYLDVDEGVDSGDIIGQTKFKIEDTDYAEDIYKKVIEGGKKLIKRFLPLLIQEKAPRIPQNKKKATFFPKITLKDNEIKLKKETPERILRKIKAFSKSYDGAFIKLKNKKIIIWKAELKNEKNV